MTRLVCSLVLCLGLCRAQLGDDCQVNETENTSSPPCAEGSVIAHGGTCSPQCLPKLRYESKLTCTNGKLSPSSTVRCVEGCAAPEGIEGAAAVACAEGSEIPEGGSCTPRCNGTFPQVSSVSGQLQCQRGRLSPSSFSCRAFECRQPDSLFTSDSPHPAATPFGVLAGAVLLWSKTLPENGMDYAAEGVCSSPAAAAVESNDGFGCRTCYSPVLAIDTMQGNGLFTADVGRTARLLIAFEASHGRRLALKLQGDLEVVWGLQADSLEKKTSVVQIAVTEKDFEPLPGEVTAADRGMALGVSLAMPYINDLEQLDSGPDATNRTGGSGLDFVRSVFTFKHPLQRPVGTDVILGVRMSLKYVIPGCSAGMEGHGSVSLALAVQNVALDMQNCTALGPADACRISCTPGFSGDPPEVTCSRELGSFAIRGCQEDCLALSPYYQSTNPDGIVDAADVSCAEGTSIRHGKVCTTRCAIGNMPDITTMVCNDGRFQPERFSCLKTCGAPDGGPLGASPPCEELQRMSILLSGTECTARCQPGFRPKWNPVPESEPAIQVSPKLLKLKCERGALLPTDNFDCQPIWLPMLDLPSRSPRHWASFTYPWQGSAAQLLALAAASQEAENGGEDSAAAQRDESVIFTYNASDPFSPLELHHLMDLGLEAVDILPVWVEGELLLVTVGQRGNSVPCGGHRCKSLCSPVLRFDNGLSSDLRVSTLQSLPLLELPGRLKAVMANRRPLLLVPGMLGHGAAGLNSCDSDVQSADPGTTSLANLPAVFTWNGSYFEESERLAAGALALEPFQVGEDIHAFACSGHRAAGLYTWPAEGGRSRFMELSEIKGAVAAAWLGCRDDLAFIDLSRMLPCSRLAKEDCTREDVSNACGMLCGCGHSAPLLAVMLSQNQSRIAIFKILPGPELVEVAASQPIVKPILSLCPIFVPPIEELFLATAAGLDPELQSSEQTSPVFLWRESGATGGGELREVQELALPGPASSCLALPRARASFLLLGGGGATDVVSRLFLAEASFAWEFGDWTPCNISCQQTSTDVGVRKRTVTCRGQPSGLPQMSGSMCPGEELIAEEKCQDLLPCAKEVFRWRVGNWGSCEGFCGDGLRQREVVCMRHMVAVNGSDTVEPEEALRATSCTDVEPPSLQACALPSCASFRLRNLLALLHGWHVVELNFYLDDDCSQKLYGKPVASGSCSSCSCKNSTGFWGDCGPELAFDDDVSIGQKAGTKWISQCIFEGQSGAACSIGEAWVGLQIQRATEIRCIRLLQSGDPGYLASEVVLESLSSEEGVWEPMAEWSGLRGGIVIDGQYNWDILRVPQLCSEIVDCNGHGAAKGLPGSCMCECHTGYDGARCGFCAPGHVDYPRCDAQPKTSAAWRLMAKGVPTAGAWHVAHVAFHSDIHCSPESEVPVAALAVEYFSSNWPASGSPASALLQNLSQSRTFGESAVESLGLRPERAFDLAEGATAWIGTCNLGSVEEKVSEDCRRGIDWVGVLLREPVEVRCIRLLQGQQAFAVDEVTFEMWWGTLPEPEPLPTEDDDFFGGNISRNVSNGSNSSDNSSGNSSSLNQGLRRQSKETDGQPAASGRWHRVRSWPDLHDAPGQPRRMRSLRMVCDQSMPSRQYKVLHDCDEDRLPWQQCRAWCEPGYSGQETVFLCLDDYSFTGVTPVCEANECKLGIPVKPGLVLAESCYGRRTDEFCTASCALGFRGDTVTYMCSTDGMLREKLTGKVGLLPACESIATAVQEQIGAASPRFGSLIVCAAAVSAAVMLLG